MLNTLYNLPTFCKEYYTFTTHHSILPFITFIVFNQNSRYIFVETKNKRYESKKMAKQKHQAHNTRKHLYASDGS